MNTCSRPGPAATINIDGIIKKKIGNTSFTPTLAARLLRFLAAAHAHEVGVGAQGIGDAGAEAVGLNQHGHQFSQLRLAGALGQAAQRFRAPLAGANLQIDQLELIAQVLVDERHSSRATYCMA